MNEISSIINSLKELTPSVAIFAIGAILIYIINRSHSKEIEMIEKRHGEQIKTISESMGLAHKEKTIAFMEREKEFLEMFKIKDDKLYSFLGELSNNLGDVSKDIRANTNSIEKLVANFERYMFKEK